MVINYRDRLTRFGYRYLQQYLQEFGVTIRSINALDEASPESELVENMIAIIHSFSGKLYRMRRTAKAQKSDS